MFSYGTAVWHLERLGAQFDILNGTCDNGHGVNGMADSRYEAFQDLKDTIYREAEHVGKHHGDENELWSSLGRTLREVKRTERVFRRAARNFDVSSTPFKSSISCFDPRYRILEDLGDEIRGHMTYMLGKRREARVGEEKMANASVVA